MRADDKVETCRLHRHERRLLRTGFHVVTKPRVIQDLIMEHCLSALDVETREYAIPPPRVTRRCTEQLPRMTVAEQELRPPSLTQHQCITAPRIDRTAPTSHDCLQTRAR